jgi:GDP-L-fucose synthase
VSIHDNSNILVTGAHGFLGHHVIRKLDEYRRGGTGGSRRNIQILTPTHRELDLMNKNQIRLYLLRTQPDIIIHLAAQCGGIGINREKPGEFLYNNLTMTTNLIEWCARLNRNESYQTKVHKFVGIGTVCSYPKHTPVPFREKDLYNGYPEETNAPYGIAKRVQLEMLKAYRIQYGFNGIFLIPVNMAGEWDNFSDDSSHVIPAMLKKFHKAKVDNASHVTLWGDGSASREFLYAGDCAEAILCATLLYNNPDPVNIGTGNEVTIQELAEKVKQVVGYEGEIKWDITKPNGQPRRCLDTSRAHDRFGFVAKTSLDDMLERSYKWAQENKVL